MTCNYCHPGQMSCSYCSNRYTTPEEQAEYEFEEALDDIRLELEKVNNLERPRTDYERGQRDALEYVLEMLEKIGKST